MQFLSRIVSASGLSRFVPSKKILGLESPQDVAAPSPQPKDPVERRIKLADSNGPKVVTRTQAKRTISSLHALLGRPYRVLAGSRSSSLIALPTLALPAAVEFTEPPPHISDFGPTADRNYFYDHTPGASSHMLLPRGLPPADPTIDVHYQLHRTDTAASDVSAFHDHRPKRKNVHFTLS